MPAPTAELTPIETALRHSPIPALRRIQVQETETTVTLIGQVSTYYYKQLAQEAVLALVPSRRLLNRVEVVADSGRPA